MILSISQPTLFPWIGYFNIIKNSDVFVFLDNVKFGKRSWHMRNRIKSVSKEEEKEIWVRIPTRMEKFDTLLKDVFIDNNQDWKSRHINAFRSCYGKSFEEIKFLLEAYGKQWEKLAEFNIEFIINCCKFLEINTKFLRASEMKTEGKKGNLILNICKELGATEYLTSVGAKEYLEDVRKSFDEVKIKISYHQYKHPVYRQRGAIFLENLSILDLLFNEKEQSKQFI